MKPRILPCISLLLLVCFVAGLAAAQENHVSVALAPSSAVPGFISYGGILKDSRGQIRSGVTGVTFLLYRDEQTGSAPLWIETQNVVPDATGHYTVQLGATTASGIPPYLFQAGAARWLALQIAGEPEQPRVLLVSVPYAMKAGDAETIGGLPPSAFVLAVPTAAGTVSAAAATPASTPVNPTVTGAGTAGSIPLWDSTSDITSSVLTQTGSGSTARIGLNITTPAATLDVKGTSNFRGTVGLPSAGIATAAGGKTSYPLAFVASVFNSGTKAAVSQNFRWQAEPVGNDTSSPAGTLNLLFGVGTTTPAETGLKIANNGQITFAAGQTFPGTGVGTITGVTAGTDLTGGGASGAVTLNLDTTKVPQLAAANTFTGNQTVNGNLSATGVVTGSSFNIGSNLFAFGSYTTGNVFLGFAGNSITTSEGNTAVGPSALGADNGGNENTAVGEAALLANLSGGGNAAVGVTALDNNMNGDYNTAEGYFALGLNTTGNNNTGLGQQAGLTNDDSYITGSLNTFLGANTSASTGTLTNATAIGAEAKVAASNSLVLGSIYGLNGATANTNVGIGVSAPQFTLDLHGGMLHVGGNVSQTPTAQGAYLQWNALTGSTGETDLINNQGKGLGGFAFMNTPNAGTPLSTLMFISGAGKVGIGTAAPDALLSVNGSADKPSGGSWGTYSDARLKTLHGSYTAGLSQIMKLHPIRYRYKDGNGMNIRDRDEHVGFVAQDVQRVIPEAVTTNSSGYLLVNNDPILWTMLNAIQQQQAEIRSLRIQLHQTAAVSKAQARPTALTQATVSGGKTVSDKDLELRHVRAELEQLRKKDARLEDRLARLEQAIGGTQASSPAVASAGAATTQPGK